MKDEDIKNLAEKLWIPFSGWGLTPKEFLELTFFKVNDQYSNLDDTVFTHSNKQELTRSGAFHFWNQWQIFQWGFTKGFKTEKIVVERWSQYKFGKGLFVHNKGEDRVFISRVEALEYMADADSGIGGDTRYRYQIK